MVVRGRTNKSPPLPISEIERKNELNLFGGVTLNENLCNWDTHKFKIALFFNNRVIPCQVDQRSESHGHITS